MCHIRLVGSLKLHVSFAKEAYITGLLQKMYLSNMHRRQRCATSWDLCVHYGVATISRLLKITRLFCKRSL